MNFHFVDRILQIESGQRVVGLKHVTASDHYLKRGRNGQWALSSCIIGEALGQLVAWAVMAEHDFTLRPVAGLVREVAVVDDVYLGETLLLQGTILSCTTEAVEYEAIATVGERTILTLRQSVGPMLPMQDFADAKKVQQHFNWINRPGEMHAASVKAPIELISSPDTVAQIKCDRILDWQHGESLTAEKNISLLAPYFPDHFPNKPVFPLSLLLECKLDLAWRFLQDMLGAEKSAAFTGVHIRNLKISEFIQPGDNIVIRLLLKARDEKSCRLQFVTELKQKRMCSAIVEFSHA